MKIGLIVEGETEKAFLPIIRKWLSTRVYGSQPQIKCYKRDGRIPTKDDLKKLVLRILESDGCDHVIALTDVYTGTSDFVDSVDAKHKMRQWVGDDERFTPHVAQHDFEAWLLPFWSTIQNKAGHNMSAPSGPPEQVNHGDPPSYRVVRIFRLGKKRRYSKARDAPTILNEQNLETAAHHCPELKAFLNTLLCLSGAVPLP